VTDIESNEDILCIANCNELTYSTVFIADSWNLSLQLCEYMLFMLWKSCFIFPICRHQEQWFTVYCSKMWKLCFIWKNVEYPKMGIVYNFVKKVHMVYLFCEYFPLYLWKWFLQRPI